MTWKSPPGSSEGHPGSRTSSRACGPQSGLQSTTCLSPEEGALPPGSEVEEPQPLHGWAGTGFWPEG